MKFNFFFNILPKFLKNRIEFEVIKKYNTKLDSQIESQKNYLCPVCDNSVVQFEPIPKSFLEMYDKHCFIHSLFCFETLNFLNYSCPKCYASDRNRLIWLFLSQELENLELNDKHFLDIAPDFQLRKKIASKIGDSYRTADLNMPDVDDHVDICNMKNYQNESFDYVLCSHVLEHVESDVVALKEFHRILKPNGKAILLVPILLNLEEDYEDKSIISEADRWKFYGLGDHLRLHSKKGFEQKIIDAGFKLSTLGVENFGESVFKKHGINNKSVLYIASKK
jgi:hypothetical protein